jgi:radical SAM superfamily enzyme YgiQ (UPF0313 family)
VIGPEPGGPDPTGFAGAALRLLLCRLSTYTQVLPSVTHRALLWSARAVPGVYADLAFRPPGEPRSREGWVATASGEPANRFDVVGITLTVPQEAFNLPRLLRASGIPLGTRARAADASAPLLLLGGHSAAVAPFLHGPLDETAADAGLVDAVVVGDGLAALREVLAAILAARARGASRAEMLRALADDVPGVYVPSLPGRTVPRRNDPPEAWRGYDGALIPWSDEPGEETLPVAFGCPHRCRFCRDGWTLGPHRQLGPDLAVEIAARLKASLAVTDLNLLSPDLGCQRELPALLARLLRLYPRLSAKSLAGISFVRSPLLAALLPRLGKREIAVGVEGASARLRRYLGKRFDPAALPGLLGPMARAGLRQAKLFFIATGLEEDADIEELGALLAGIAGQAPRLRLLVSAMPFFPAPGTPLGFAPLRDVRESLRRIQTAAEDAGAEFRLSASPEEIRCSALLVRAGPAATAALVRASTDDGIAYDDELRPKAAEHVERLLAKSGVDVAALAGKIPAAAPYPWDELDLGTPRRTLRTEYRRALAALEDGPGADDRPGPPASRTAARRRAAETAVVAEAASVEAVRRLPDPFADRSTRALVFRLAPAAAERPGLTLARGALREWLLRDEAAATAFCEVGPVLGVPGTCGLRVAPVAFAASLPLLKLPAIAGPVEPGRAAPALPVTLLDAIPARPWFTARCADASQFDLLRSVVAETRPVVKHRVERTPNGRRLLVDKGFWNRCGLAAAYADDDGLRLYLSAAGESFARGVAPPGAPLECVELLDGEPQVKCPVCRLPAFRRRYGAGADGALVCPSCGGEPVRSGRTIPG